MSLLIVTLCIVILVILIVSVKANPFIAFLIVSIAGGLLLGIPVDSISKAIQTGIGDILSSLVMIIVFGAMLGKLVAESGAAQRIATAMMNIFGKKNILWGLVAAGFIIGIPLFYSVGFVLMVPLIFSVVYKYKLPAVYIGLPMLAALSVTHGFLPPHPSPAAIVTQLNADMGLTLLYGFIVAVPAIVISGPVFAQTLKHIKSEPIQAFQPKEIKEAEMPGAFNSIFSALLPVILIIITTLFQNFGTDGSPSRLFAFLGDASIVMLISLIYATYSLGLKMGKSMQDVMNIYTDAVKDIAMIVLIIAGAGALKQVLQESGVSDEIANALMHIKLSPLFLGWLIAAIIRVCIGSATVAGLTAAGIIAPLIAQTGTDPNLMVLSIGAGSLMFSHVNDPGFWLFKEYFNLSIKDTILSWSIMETLVAVVGLAAVLLLSFFI